jgi:hypothetical protein
MRSQNAPAATPEQSAAAYVEYVPESPNSSHMTWMPTIPPVGPGTDWQAFAPTRHSVD